jgi:hypothetical protein
VVVEKEDAVLCLLLLAHLALRERAEAEVAELPKAVALFLQ